MKATTTNDLKRLNKTKNTGSLSPNSEIKRKFKTRIGILQDRHGNTLTQQDEIKGRWKEYAEELYRRDLSMTNCFTEEAWEEQPMSLQSQIEAALKSIGRNKASGTAGIPIELFQALDDDAVKVLTRICQRIWTIGQ